MISIREDFYWMLTTPWQLPFDPSQTENMKNGKPVASFILVAVILPEVLGQVVAETPNKIELQSLVGLHLPGCHFRLDGAGKPEALIAPTGEVLDLTSAARDNPEPKEALGYWCSPSMASPPRHMPRCHKFGTSRSSTIQSTMLPLA